MEGEGEIAEGLVEFQPVIGRFGLRQAGKLVRGRPVELSAVDHDATGHRAVAGHVFGQAVHDQRGAKLDGLAQIGRGQRIVDDQRQAQFIRKPGHGGNVGDIAARVRDRFAKDRAGVLIHSGAQRVEIVEIDEFRAPAKAADGLAELGDGATVKPGRGDDVAPRRHQRKQRHDLRGMTGGAADGARTALHRGDARLQRGDGRIGQARIDIADFLQAKKPRGMAGILKDIGCGLIDRHLTRAGGRIGRRPGVDGGGVKTPVVGHRDLPSLVRAQVRSGRDRLAMGMIFPAPSRGHGRIWVFGKR